MPLILCISLTAILPLNTKYDSKRQCFQSLKKAWVVGICLAKTFAVLHFVSSIDVKFLSEYATNLNTKHLVECLITYFLS